VFQVVSGWAGRRDIVPDSPWESASPVAGPNIYLIMADGQGRADVLGESYGLDSSAFVAALEAEGFTTASASRSNYMLTQLTLGSMLNGMHLDELGVPDGAPIPTGLLERAIEEPGAVDLARLAGYETIAIPSGYDSVRVRSADHVVESGQLSEFEAVILGSTALDPAIRSVWPTYLADALRGRTYDTLATLEALAAEGPPAEGHPPRFVFAHLPLPHFPYIVDADCRPVDRGGPNLGGSPETGSAKTPLLLPEKSVRIRSRRDLV
jgi:hypothetical protein